MKIRNILGSFLVKIGNKILKNNVQVFSSSGTFVKPVKIPQTFEEAMKYPDVKITCYGAGGGNGLNNRKKREI